jgi:hypothetical protein
MIWTWAAGTYYLSQTRWAQPVETELPLAACVYSQLTAEQVVYSRSALLTKPVPHRSEQEREEFWIQSLSFFFFYQTEKSQGSDPNRHTDRPEMNSSEAVRHNFKYSGGGVGLGEGTMPCARGPPSWLSWAIASYARVGEGSWLWLGRELPRGLEKKSPGMQEASWENDRGRPSKFSVDANVFIVGASCLCAPW